MIRPNRCQGCCKHMLLAPCPLPTATWAGTGTTKAASPHQPAATLTSSVATETGSTMTVADGRRPVGAAAAASALIDWRHRGARWRRPGVLAAARRCAVEVNGGSVAGRPRSGALRRPLPCRGARRGDGGRAGGPPHPRPGLVDGGP